MDREAMLLLGAGPRALLMQLAHPAVAAGVDEHSDFRADPWRRLDGTLRSYLRIIYGSTPAARDEIRRLNALHRGITGSGYDARDPGPVDVGARDARRLDDRRQRRVGGSAVPRAGSAVLRRDQADRAGVRRTRVATCRLDLDAFEAYLADQLRPGRTGTGRTGGARARRGDPPSATPRGPRDGPGSTRGCTTGRCGRPSACCPGPIREAYGFRWGPARTDGLRLARRRVACVDARAPAVLPTDAAGARRRPADGCGGSAAGARVAAAASTSTSSTTGSAAGTAPRGTTGVASSSVLRRVGVVEIR